MADNREYTLVDLTSKVMTASNNLGVHNLNDDELHFACKKINEFYDNWQFDRYVTWLDCLTLNSQQYNWLEDLCTDLRYLMDWDKC